MGFITLFLPLNSHEVKWDPPSPLKSWNKKANGKPERKFWGG